MIRTVRRAAPRPEGARRDATAHRRAAACHRRRRSRHRAAEGYRGPAGRAGEARACLPASPAAARSFPDPGRTPHKGDGRGGARAGRRPGHRRVRRAHRRHRGGRGHRSGPGARGAQRLAGAAGAAPDDQPGRGHGPALRLGTRPSRAGGRPRAGGGRARAGSGGTSGYRVRATPQPEAVAVHAPDGEALRVCATTLEGAGWQVGEYTEPRTRARYLLASPRRV